MSFSLDVKNLSISLGRHRIVQDVSFSVAPGETYGIVGESGSGQSTILRVLAGLHSEWSGDLSLGGGAAFANQTPPGADPAIANGLSGSLQLASSAKDHRCHFVRAAENSRVP